MSPFIASVLSLLGHCYRSTVHSHVRKRIIKLPGETTRVRTNTQNLTNKDRVVSKSLTNVLTGLVSTNCYLHRSEV